MASNSEDEAQTHQSQGQKMRDQPFIDRHIEVKLFVFDLLFLLLPGNLNESVIVYFILYTRDDDSAHSMLYFKSPPLDPAARSDRVLHCIRTRTTVRRITTYPSFPTPPHSPRKEKKTLGPITVRLFSRKR